MIRLVIKGALASMKNRRIPLKNNPWKTIPNAEARAFASTFDEQVPPEARQHLGSLKEPLHATVTVYYRDMRSDLDAAHVYDLLQKSGVVSNDRYIRKKSELALIDKENPRVEIEVEYM